METTGLIPQRIINPLLFCSVFVSFLAPYTVSALSGNGLIQGNAVTMQEENPHTTTLITELSTIKGVLNPEIRQLSRTESAPDSRLKEAVHEKKDDIARSEPFAFRQTRIFEPLIADPRWPHFSTAFQYYIDDEELKSVGATSFGETIPLYSGDALFNGQWQFGIQAAVFAIFDLDSESMDLINADYRVGIPISYKRKSFSGLFRIFHQSSHLGDEYLLRSRIDRVNLSYEGFDMKLSYTIRKGFRMYAGSGLLLRKEPDNLKPWSTQFGLEFRGPKNFFGNMIIPLAGADFKNRQENNWKTDVSLRGGFQFRIERVNTSGYNLQLMIEYFNGYSPNGQFYTRSIEYISIGTHFYF